MSTAVYFLNCFTNKAIEAKTPYEAWHGRTPNVSHLKVLASTA